MIRPQPFAFIAGSARRMVWKAALRLSAMIRSHFSTGNWSTGATCWVPALLTRMSIAAELVGLGDHRLDRSGRVRSAPL